MLTRLAVLVSLILVASTAPTPEALAQQGPIALDIPAQFPIRMPAASPSACWKVARPADGRITATVEGPGTWNVCIGDASCPMACGGPLRSASTEPHTQGSHYFVKVESQSPDVTATLSIYPTAGAAPGPPGSGGDCGLGVRWDVNESGWAGTWVRRGTSNIFDATWQKGGAAFSSVLTMTLTGNRVHVERRDAPAGGGAYVVYDGTIASDRTVSGTAKVPASGATPPFHATIRCDAAPPGTGPGGSGVAAVDCGLGQRWKVAESGWSGTWVRRGTSNVFDATWQKGSTTFASVLTMTQTGNRVHIERKDAASGGGAFVLYDGTVGADGTVTGTATVPATGAALPFRATIGC